MPAHEYLKPAEVAARYRIAVSTLANYRSAGTGPPYVRTPALRILYRADQVEAWVTGQPEASGAALVAA